MPYTKPSSSDTRGWRPREGGEEAKKGERCGENETPRKTATMNYPTGDMRQAEKAVTMDNMGNSPSINIKTADAPRIGTPREQAITVETAPTVPLSSYEGVNIAGSDGIKLEKGFRTQIADRETRPEGKQFKNDNSAKVAGASAESAKNGWDISQKNPIFNKATIQGGMTATDALMGKSVGADKGKFEKDGANPSNVESKVMGDKAIRKESDFEQARKKSMPGCIAAKR
ncbi:hypothetical protein KKE45_04140 [Patescibacteria group bacterium]|nr:hypothetical protein [Patescibacteria group bacterium]